MRMARLVGLSPDGKFLIVATESGEQMTIVADDRLRAALRGDRPRLGQLEIEMDSALTPRDIQSRIRSGQSLEDVTKVAGIPLDRVERFATPVLAERRHVAGLAMSSSVRRRGETAAHRNLRVTLTERLMERGVDIDTLAWDSYRTEDGRWAITADYRSGEAERQAMFVFDLLGRFSVAGNDEARWVLGEQSPVNGPQPGRARGVSDGADDTEPTLDLNDELALVRAVQEPGPTMPLAVVQELRPRVDLTLNSDPAPESEGGEPAELESQPEECDPMEGDEPIEVDATEDDPSFDDPSFADPSLDQPGSDEPTSAESGPHETSTGQPGSGPQLDFPFDMLGGDGYAEDSVRVYSGLSDATAVPETASGAWEPPTVAAYPVEPSRSEESEPVADHGPEGSDATLPAEPPSVQPLGEPPHEVTPSEDPPNELPGTDLPGPTPPSEAPPVGVPPNEVPPLTIPGPDLPGSADQPADRGGDQAEGDSFQLESEPAVPVKKPVKRKRASVPSWDEIMFGGPRRQG